jgi:ribonuclease P protein component
VRLEDARTGESFPKSARLLKRPEFELVYSQGRRNFSANYTFFFLPRMAGTEASGPRVGITVGRVLGKAVERNRIKRRTREAVRKNLSVLRLDIDIVINPKRSVLESATPALESEIARAFAQIAENPAAGAAARERTPRRAKGAAKKGGKR